MNIESKIHFKAAGLYIIVGIAAVVMLIYLYDLRSNLKNQRQEVEKQHHSLAMINELIYAVNEAQSSASLFVSTNDKVYINQFDRKLILIDSLINTLVIIEPVGKEKLLKISSLLKRQASNISELNRQFGAGNPLAAISERIQNYKPKRQGNSHIITTKKDTVFKTTGREKNIFKRIKEVFSPERNTTVVVSTQQVDTLRLEHVDSFPILAEVKNMANSASKYYEKNIRSIGRQVTNLITSDREISTQISGLLLNIHRQTLNSVLESIDRSEKSINRNYTISIIGSILALGLILMFILLIIYDVNKGKESRERIRQVMESRHQLLLSVSHDIKSPLGSILGYLELRDQQGEDIMSMQNSARHILALLENLLEFSSLEQGSLMISNSNFSINEVCEEIGQMFLQLAESKNLSFTFSSDKDRLNSDQMKIKQIVINLVSNAMKYTRVGKINLKMKYADGQLCIEVTDTGVGIPEDKLAEIYEPFTRVESNNALAHGTGLGMYVVKGLIELLDGTIHITSKVSKGTKIEVIIPCAKAENKIKQGAKKIALYDDDPVVVEIVRGMLVRLGHEVVEHNYDVILTDMEMGQLSGLDILASAGNVSVIVMTGHSDYTAEKASELGFDGFLLKPFTIDDLREIFGNGEKVADNLFGEDYEEIMAIFRISTEENFVLLRQALNDSDFNRAQSICHKMLPIFAQLCYPVSELSKMDAQRGNGYEGWQTDVNTILSIIV